MIKLDIFIVMFVEQNDQNGLDKIQLSQKKSNEKMERVACWFKSEHAEKQLSLKGESAIRRRSSFGLTENERENLSLGSKNALNFTNAHTAEILERMSATKDYSILRTYLYYYTTTSFAPTTLRTHCARGRSGVLHRLHGGRGRGWLLYVRVRRVTYNTTIKYLVQKAFSGVLGLDIATSQRKEKNPNSDVDQCEKLKDTYITK